MITYEDGQIQEPLTVIADEKLQIGPDGELEIYGAYRDATGKDLIDVLARARA